MKPYYHRKLPHWIPPGAIFFITFRLANSLPQPILQALKEERERERQAILAQWDGAQQRAALYTLDKTFFGQYDAWLDRCLEASPRWLADEQVARLVADTLHASHGRQFDLVAYCIMPNHVHLLIDTERYVRKPAHRGVTAPYPLTDLLKQIKGRTARYCNQLLKRSGSFWQHESYDHVVRDSQEYERIVRYTLNNPVRAGLVEEWQHWPFTYIRPGEI